MYLLVLVIDDPDKCVDVLPAWEDAGAPGATILESTGMQRVLERGARDDLPLMPSIGDILKKVETRHRTIFSVIRDVETIERIARVTEEIIGPFDDENTGFMFSLRVDQVFGLRSS
jgi:hypothetical protein